jgi:hypothetical protein
MGMQSQVKIFCCLALFVSVFTPFLTHAADFGWDVVKNEKIQILEHSSAQGEVISSYFPLAINVGRWFYDWEPSSEPKNTPNKVELDSAQNTSQLTLTLRHLFIHFDLSDTKHFRKVWIEPKKGLKFRGIFGIHDFVKKRPFVIIRMGIHGNVDEFTAERFLAKVVYENLDANFLMLENLTSHAFLSNNAEFSFGGIDEGLQTFFTLQEIQKNQLNDIVSSYHLVGLSLGGHGVFVTTLLDQANGQKIKSVVDFCPVINLKETQDFHLAPSLSNLGADLWNMMRLQSLYKRQGLEQEFSGIWESLFDFKPRFVPAMMRVLNRDRKVPLLTVEDMNSFNKNMRWPKGFAEHLQNSASFDELNEFWSLYQGVKTPFTIYTTPNDLLVPNEVNSERIFTGRQAGDFTSLKYIRLEKGFHCGISSVYNWDYVVELMKQGLKL